MRLGSLGLPELVLILLILVLIFGANRLPELGRSVGKAIRNFKEAGSNKDNDQAGPPRSPSV